MRVFLSVVFLAHLTQISPVWSQHSAVIMERPFQVVEPEAVYIGSIHYPALSAKMGPRGLRQLAILVADIKEEPGRKVRIIGYSRRGRADLALARANDVAGALRNFGISMDKAMISTVTLSGKKEDSRVDILLEKRSSGSAARSFSPVWVLLFIGFFFLIFLAAMLTARSKARPPWL